MSSASSSASSSANGGIVSASSSATASGNGAAQSSSPASIGFNNLPSISKMNEHLSKPPQQQPQQAPEPNPVTTQPPAIEPQPPVIEPSKAASPPEQQSTSPVNNEQSGTTISDDIVSITSSTIISNPTSISTDSAIPPTTNPSELPASINTLKIGDNQNTNFVTSTSGIILLSVLCILTTLAILLIIKYRNRFTRQRTGIPSQDFWLGTDTETGQLKINRRPSNVSAGSSDWGWVFANSKKESKIWDL